MLLLSQIKVKPGYKQEDLIKRAASLLKVSIEDILSLQIERRSIDARKNEIFYVFSLCVLVKNESNVYKRVKDNNVTLLTNDESQIIPQNLNKKQIIIFRGLQLCHQEQ